MADDPTPHMLDAVHVAAELCVSKRTAYERMREMRHLRSGAIIRVSRQALDAWIEAHTHAPPAPVGPPEVRATSRRPSHAGPSDRTHVVTLSDGSLLNTRPPIRPQQPRRRKAV